MNDRTLTVVRLACTLSLTLLVPSCREDIGCPPGTVLVGNLCEAAPDMGMPHPDGGDACTPIDYYPDLDEDGVGAGEPVSACSAPEGYVDNDDDCDDTCAACDGGEEVCDGEDNDCDGETDEDISVVCGTNEGECSTGTQACVGGVLGACEGDVEPAIAEVCDGTKDENCDGEVDEDCDCTAGDTRPCGTDTGECATGTQTCTPAGVYGDCEDAVGPTTEMCNELDDDCDGVDDNGNPGGGAVCGTDVGACMVGTMMCVGGDVVCTGSVGPVPEVCNDIDDDCANGVDEGVTATFYRDSDSDGRGTPGMTRQACSVTAGWVANSSDCNDMCSVCWTGASETCDMLDNNCTGGVDEGVTTRFYQDADGDMRGNPLVFADACGVSAGYVVNSNDCDDTCNVCWTGNADVCDAEDNDCSGAPDETFTCVPGTSTSCMTSCNTMGTGTCTAVCEAPAAAACTPPAETCDAVDQDCDGYTDEGVRTFDESVQGPIGSAAKLARGNTGFIGIVRYNSSARIYRADAAGAVTVAAADVDASDVVSVDIARIDTGNWVTASGFSDGAVNVRLIGLPGTDPVSMDVERVNSSGTGGIVRVAANSATDSMVVYQAGSAIRVSAVDFVGAVATSLALPGSNPRAELGMDVAARGAGNGYLVAWVTGTSPTVNLAIVSAGLVVASNAVLGAGTNPTIAVSSNGVVGVAYAGPDNLPRFHQLTMTLSCVSGGGARNTCPVTTSTRTVVTPVGAGTFNSTLDIEAAGTLFWLAARTSDGEMVQRIDSVARETIFRVSAATSWITVTPTSTGMPMILRGVGSGYNHNMLGCP